MIGIDNLKKISKNFIEIVEQGNESFADGIQAVDFTDFIDELMGTIKNVGSFKELGKEVRDLSAEERDELRTYLKSEFDIPNDKVEAVIETILDALVANANAIYAIINLKKTTVDDSDI